MSTHCSRRWQVWLIAFLVAVLTSSLAAALPAPSAAPETGWWVNPAQPGRAYFIERNRNQLGFLAVLYAQDGRSTWRFAAGRMPCAWSYFGGVYRLRGGQTLDGAHRPVAAVELQSQMLLRFDHSAVGTLSWPGESIPIVKLALPATAVPTGRFAPESGLWWNPAEPGRGFLIEIRDGFAVIVVAAYDDDGAPVWLMSSGAMSEFDLYRGSLVRLRDGQTQGGDYRAPQVENAAVAELRLRFVSADEALLSIAGRADVSIQRLPLAPTVAGPLLEMPIQLDQAADAAFGLVPFGVHLGDHAQDGHPGWDIEFAPGSRITAPISGTIDSLIDDQRGNTGIAISTSVAGQAYRVDLGIGTPVEGLAVGSRVTAGQPLGSLPAYDRIIGTRAVRYSQTHFQFDDFSYNVGLTNPFAKTIEGQLSPAARRIFDALWKTSRYPQQLCEPFPSNRRSTTPNDAFYRQRSWSRYSGGLASSFEVDCDAQRSRYTYSLRDASGVLQDRGTLMLETAGVTTSTLDMISDQGGPNRRGLYEVSCNVLRLDYGQPGGARPGSLNDAAIYTTADDY